MCTDEVHEGECNRLDETAVGTDADKLQRKVLPLVS